MSEDNKVVEMEERKELVEGGSEPREKKRSDNVKKNEMKVDVDKVKDTIVVSRGNDFVKGFRFLQVDAKEHYKDLVSNFDSARLRGKNDVTVTRNKDGYKKTKNPNYILWDNLLTDWSKDEPINKTDVGKERRLGPLLYKFLEVAKEENELNKTEADEAKN